MTKNHEDANEAGELDEMLNDIRNLETLWKPEIRHILHKYQGVMVAHSGGVDSTALFHLIWQIFKAKKNFQLSLFHMNFGLRGEASDRDELFSRDLADQFKLPFHSEAINQESRDLRSGQSLQEWARIQRYQALKKWEAKGWAIAFGHTLDDVAENVLIRLSRGSSVGKLAGMSRWNAPHWRPLLDVSKAELQDYLGKKCLLHRHDATNDKIDYSRNFIRHEVIAKLEDRFPGSSQRIAETARDAQDLQEWTERHLSLLLAGQGRRNARFINDLPAGVARLAVASLMREGNPHRRLSRQLIDDAVSVLRKDARKRWSRDLPDGGRIVIQDEGVFVEKSAAGPSLGQIGHQKMVRWGVAIEGESQESLSCQGAQWEVRSRLRRRVNLSCKTLGINQHLRFPCGMNETGLGFSAENLLQDLRIGDIPTEKRHNVLMVEIDHALAGIYREGVIWVPDRKRNWNPLNDIEIKLVNEL